MSAKLVRERFPESLRVLEIPPNDFGLALIGLDMNRFPFTPTGVVIVGIDPESGEEESFSVTLMPETR